MIRNQDYWDDLIFEGRILTETAEGQPRDLVVPRHEADQVAVRKLAEAYRASVSDARHRDPHRPEHQLQDVIDAYRWTHPETSRRTPRGIGRTGRQR